MSFEESQPIFLWLVFEAPPDLMVFWHRPCYTVQPRDFDWDSSQGFVLASQLHLLWSSEDGWSPGVMHVLGCCLVGGQRDDPVLQLNAWGFVSNSLHNLLSLWPLTVFVNSSPACIKASPEQWGVIVVFVSTIPNLAKSFTSVLEVVHLSFILSRVFFPESLKCPTSYLCKACSVLCGSLWI